MALSLPLPLPSSNFKLPNVVEVVLCLIIFLFLKEKGSLPVLNVQENFVH